MGKNGIYDLMKRINKESKKAEHYDTGLIGEQIIVASYKQMPLDKLEKMMFIISKIIKQKKEFIRVANAQKTNNVEGIPEPKYENESKEIQDSNKEKKIEKEVPVMIGDSIEEER